MLIPSEVWNSIKKGQNESIGTMEATVLKGETRGGQIGLRSIGSIGTNALVFPWGDLL